MEWELIGVLDDVVQNDSSLRIDLHWRFTWHYGAVGLFILEEHRAFHESVHTDSVLFEVDNIAITKLSLGIEAP